MQKPALKPANPCFSSGPCPKRPGWQPAVLGDALVGRSHRSKPGKARLNAAIDATRQVLGVPDDYLVGIVPGSDTGAVEMALWNLLGPRGVDVLAWESFGSEWVTDVLDVLAIDDARKLVAPYGELPDLGQVDFTRDVVFVWNGTTSGVKLPDGEWIPAGRAGLTVCDATSAAFAMPLPWDKLDVTTFSWQKVLGGEAAHGVIILSPRAVARLESFVPPRPLPKLFRLTKKGKVDRSIFDGATINTPSMLCVEDYLDALRWASDLGGLEALCQRSNQNLAVLEAWVAKTPWVDFLAAQPAQRSNTSICLKIVADWFLALDDDAQAELTKKMSSLLEKEGAAFDINGYRSAPPGLRIWGGATVEAQDLAALLPWLEWAYATIAADHAA
ncbi:MAG: phosphoserine transaminase [Gammaproteobacteria bacterium]|nr:phosphoserine transaminase [Gammaproteobacteria bacterium]MCP5198950.1 phosphoserine transaminase [Gammaproteobacteria bacterium]